MDIATSLPFPFFSPFLLSNPSCNDFGSALSREKEIQGEGGLEKIVAARIWIALKCKKESEEEEEERERVL